MPNPEFLPGQDVPASTLQLLGDDIDWTPELTAATSDPDLGTGAQQEARAHRNGNRVEVWGFFGFGTGSSAGSGRYEVALPAGFGHWTTINLPVGEWRTVQGGTVRTGATILAGATDDLFFNFEDGTSIGPTTPVAWDDGHFLEFHASWYTDLL